MALIVSTERLGTPGEESSWLERRGFEQKMLVYQNQRDQPSATCHLQPSQKANALCGYQWEGLVSVPGAVSFSDVPIGLRCPKCQTAAAGGTD
jgi:hypothetical protein